MDSRRELEQSAEANRKSGRKDAPKNLFEARKKLYDRIKISVRTLDIIICGILALIVAAIIIGMALGSG